MSEEESNKSALSLNIEIDSDGRVVFTDLPQDLIDLVYELDPDAQIACSMPQRSDEAPKADADTSSETS